MDCKGRVPLLRSRLGDADDAGRRGIGANTWNVETDGSLVRAGINYRFNSLKCGQ